MPGIACLIVTLVVNYVGHRTRRWRTICGRTRDLPFPVTVAGLVALYGWLTPHLLRGYEAKRLIQRSSCSNTTCGDRTDCG